MLIRAQSDAIAFHFLYNTCTHFSSHVRNGLSRVELNVTNDFQDESFQGISCTGITSFA